VHKGKSDCLTVAVGQHLPEFTNFHADILACYASSCLFYDLTKAEGVVGQFDKLFLFSSHRPQSIGAVVEFTIVSTEYLLRLHFPDNYKMTNSGPDFWIIDDINIEYLPAMSR
jgi:hypothetical protein